MCGCGEEVSVVAPQQSDCSVLPVERADADVVEVALEMLQARSVEFLDGSLFARVAEVEVDV